MKTSATMSIRAQANLSQLLTLAAGLALVAGCALQAPAEAETRISVCGGFAQQEQTLDADPAAYCDAEVLRWQYDAASEKLTLSNTRVTLNCCGEHSMSAAEDGDLWVVTERDAPEQVGLLPGDTARCGCMCVFDFEIAINGVAGDAVEVKLVRDITDVETGPTTAWQGVIDLTAGQGEIVVDASESTWCQASAS